MKSLILVLCFVLGCFILVNGQPIDSTTTKKPAEKSVEQKVNSNDSQPKAPAETKAAKEEKANPNPIELHKGMVIVLSLLPIIMFIIIILSVGKKLKTKGVKLSYFLLDKETLNAMDARRAEVAKARLNAIAKSPQAAAAINNLALIDQQEAAMADDDGEEPPKQEDQSVSRLIVYLTGITTLALASCITSFYFYRCFMGETKPDLSNLSTVLLGLGLGVIPYGFTKVASALKS